MTRFFHSWILAHSRTAAAFGVCVALIFSFAACGYKAKPFYEPLSKSDKKSQDGALDSKILDSQAQDSKTPNSQQDVQTQKNQKTHTIQGIDSHTTGEDEGD